MSISATFVIIWIAFTLATVLAALPILVWAVRSGQFSDKDYACRLPLLNDGPKTDEPEGASRRDGAPQGDCHHFQPEAPISRPNQSVGNGGCTRARQDGAPKGGGGNVLP